ncbi:MAG: HEAT repeat domain-containing protein [Armatimonadota bacterium]
MKRIIEVFLIKVCLLLFLMPLMAQAPQMPNQLSDSDAFRDMSKEEIAYEYLSRKAYRPSWAPLPLLREKSVYIPALLNALKSSDAKVRARAAFILGQIGAKSAIVPLTSLLKDKDADVRRHTGIALACLGDKKGLPACEIALKTGVTWIKYYAVLGLWNINSRESKNVLKEHSELREVLAGASVRGALKSKYASAPAVREASGKTPPPGIEQVWESAANVFSKEADWWWHKGNYDQAIRCHEAAVLIDPDYPESYSIIAWLQWSLDRDAEAINTLKRGITANPKNHESYYNLGTHYYNTKRYKESDYYLRKAVQLGGGHLVKRIYAHSLEKNGKLGEALFQWKEIVHLRPDDLAAKRMYDKLKTKVGR